MDNSPENETEQKKNIMNRTQNTFLSTGSSRKFKVNSNFRITNSSNMNKFLPPISTSLSDFDFSSNNSKNLNSYYPLKSDLIKKNYDSNNLIQRLSDNKMDMNKKVNEFTELKIRYCKLLEENKNIKNLLAKVLDAEVDKEFSKGEIIDKIEQCNPTEEEKVKLKQAYDIIKLKMEINDKKTKISDINKQIEYYIKNAKSKTINDLENEYILKSKHQNKIQKIIEKLEINTEDNNKILEDIKKKYISKKDLNIKLKSEFSEIDKKLREAEDKKDKLDNIVIDLREKQRKIKDRIKVNKYKSENEESILFKKIDLENIENYIKKRDTYFKDIEVHNNNIKILEKERLDLDKIIQELSNKNNELSIKMDNYNKEGPKLIQKSYEPLNNQRNMIDLEEKLKIFRKEYELTQKEHEDRQHELQGELDELNEKIDDNNKIINKNNDEKNKLNGEIDELNKKINENKEEIKEKENKIKMTQKDMEDYIINEEKNKKEEEEKEKMNEEENKKNEELKNREQLKKEREFKKEINLLKKEIDKFKNDNKYIEIDNNNIKKEIEEYDETINQCEDIDDKIKEALEQIEQLKL